MKRVFALLLLGWAAATLAADAANPVLRVVKSSAGGASLLRNGDFEQTRDGQGPGWSAAPKGYRAAPGEGRGGSTALRAENPATQGHAGASQTLTLNRTHAAPLIVRGWSKAENVSGSADSGYSLYVDLVYADGTPLWGQTGNFRCGTHDWQPAEFIIMPDQPVKSLSFHCIFRGHSGRVWFDDVSVEEVKAEGGAVLFQGVPVMASPTNEHPAIPGPAPAPSDGVFLARDVAASSDFFGFQNNTSPDLGLKLTSEFLTQSNCTVVQGRVSDTTGRDRAITLVFALPLDATGWRWGDDIRRSRLVQGRGEFANQIGVRCGATGTMSLYPIAPVWNDQAGQAIALDMARPAQYRVGYHAGLKRLFIAYDFGLVKDTERFPSSAEFRFVLYPFDPRGGFRAAFQKLMEIFPDQFAVRSKEQGLWMPFTDVSKVPGWQDFGFRYHEGNNNVPWDDAHGVLSFRYTEPMTWWMAMKKDSPRTPAEALRVLDELAQGKNDSTRRFAEVSRTAAMFDESGLPALQFQDTPWCNGAVWSLNPNPWLRASAPASNFLNAATIHWSDSIKDQLYGPAAKGRLDGEYLDSLEGYVTANLNYRREHFRFTTVPLTFATDTQRPALFKGLAVAEFTRWISEDVHRLGQLMFANGVPYRFTFLCPWLDVLGTETDWLRAGKYAPSPITQMDLWRTMSGAKPYLLLMNTDYDQFTPALVEKYFHRSLFYGMWPGFFSHNASENPYWQNPKWYDRDRPLFKKYLPLIKRVAEAGWQPLTEAASDNPLLLVERFGPDAQGAVYVTLFNDTAQPQTGILSVNLSAPRFPAATPAQEMISGTPAEQTPGGWRITLPSHQAAVIQFAR